MKTTITFEGKEIKITGKFIKSCKSPFSDNMMVNKFEIVVYYEDRQVSFDFFDNHNNYCDGKKVFSEKELAYCLECFILDSICGTMEFEDFIRELGYNSMAQGKKNYLACVDQSEKCDFLFGNDFDIDDFLLYIQENL